ncbi:MAG: ribonuclease HII [Candidatus Pacebacteria bacterium]|nr:ribonuclease HII [Candidatus Paceibacterota bacterium]
MEWLIGIDEAGRGALAGPVSVGVVLYPADLDWKEAFSLVAKKGKPVLRDSKQLTSQQRTILFGYITSHARLRHAHAFSDAKTIDEIGIVNATNEAAARAIEQLGIRPSRVSVLLDAGLRVPAKWSQESFVRGDENIPAIAFASIIAKVSRDRYMEEAASVHTGYQFGEHKGYGTEAHRRYIRKAGLCELHRVTFCTRI